jgi:spore germination cell wall hydrolase CwlJ-like protein
MAFALIWRRLAVLAGEVRTHVMVEIERNPLAVRQGAATIMCLAAAAVAMPVISYRAAEQRDGAEWAATSTAFQAELRQQLAASAEPNARVELTAFRSKDGLRASGSASLFESEDARAMLVQAVLRGPTQLKDDNIRPAEPALNQREHGCLAQAIYFEARGETQRGQQAVAEVVMNRVRSPHYPDTICGVVYQGSERVTGCQFTFTCDGSLGHRPRGRAWDRAQRMATAVMLGYTRPITQRSTHYHTMAVNPVWSAGLVETMKVDSHIFYRFPNASERPVYQAALERRLGSRRAARSAETASAGEESLGAAAAEAPLTAQPSPEPAAPVEAPAAPVEGVVGEEVAT